MLSLRGIATTPRLQHILTHPCRSLGYEDAPELVQSHLIATYGKTVPTMELHNLGNGTQTPAISGYPALPDLYIHELRDVTLYDSILYSRQGGFFIDSARTFTQQHHISLWYGPGSMLRHIGGQYYVPDDPKGSERMHEESTVLMPCFSSHMVYGHWLLEGLTALWALPHVRQLAGTAKVQLLCSPITHIPHYMKIFCKAFGLTEYDFYIPAKHMLLHKLYMPTKSYMHMGYVTPAAQQIWDTVKDYLLPQATIDPIDKIYISRRKVAKRSLENEDACEALFARRGFTIVHPQELSLPDQIALFAHATHITGPVGSAVHNVVFSNRPKELTTLFLGPSDYSSFKAITLIEQAYGRKGQFVYGTARTPSRRSWHIDITTLSAAIERWLG